MVAHKRLTGDAELEFKKNAATCFGKPEVYNMTRQYLDSRVGLCFWRLFRQSQDC